MLPGFDNQQLRQVVKVIAFSKAEYLSLASPTYDPLSLTNIESTKDDLRSAIVGPKATADYRELVRKIEKILVREEDKYLAKALLSLIDNPAVDLELNSSSESRYAMSKQLESLSKLLFGNLLDVKQTFGIFSGLLTDYVNGKDNITAPFIRDNFKDIYDQTVDGIKAGIRSRSTVEQTALGVTSVVFS
jgi:hypothetical protein